MQLIIHYVIAALWFTLVCYWVILARQAKPNIPRQRFYGLPLRVALLVLFIVILSTPQLRLWLRRAHSFAAHNVFIALIGLLICALGCALAVAARVQLGRNWGMPMSQKLRAELVTGGPYAYARHPIYGGLMLALLGSALAENLVWLLPFVLFTPYFVFSALREEKLLLSQFPDAYRAYRQHTKLLIPFVV